jgi:hypothetical protein
MKKNKLYLFIICCIITIWAIFGYCNCYAETVEFKDIMIPCSIDFYEAPWHYEPGEPNTRYAIMTKGMQIAGIDELVTVTNWRAVTNTHPTTVHVDAKCISLDDHYEHWLDMWPIFTPTKPLICEWGETLAVKMFTPNDSDPKKYQYAATITITKRDEKIETIQKKIELRDFNPLNSFFKLFSK